MIAGILITAAAGIFCLISGILLWKKDRLTLLHSYHTEHVSEENKHAFCTLSGIGIVLIGAGLLGSAILLGITESAWSFLCFAAGLAAGIVLLLCAGSKYNHI